MQRMANVDGKITPLDEARVPVLDRGFLYGDSVYEVFRTYDGVPLFCQEHFDRLENSARLISMTITQSREEMLEEMRRTIAAADVSKGQDIYVRWHVTRGAGALDLIPSPDAKTTYVIIVKEVPPWKPEFYSRGMSLAVTRTRRNPVEALSPDIKSGNYLNNILAVSEAVSGGADDCLMLNPAGNVTEASNSNVFFVIDGKLVTPNAASGILRGITKAALARACAANDISLLDATIPVGDLPRTSECFVTSATREVMPVSALKLEDGTWHEYPAGGGPLTKRVSAAYKDEVAKYVCEHAELRLL